MLFEKIEKVDYKEKDHVSYKIIMIFFFFFVIWKMENHIDNIYYNSTIYFNI